MKKLNFNYLILAGSLTILALQGCKKDKDLVPVPQPTVNEQENITTLRLKFTEQGTTNTFTVNYADPDGAGGNPPTSDTIKVVNGKMYDVEAMFLDESKSPAEDLTPEILEEKNDHIVCFNVVSGAVTIARTDLDDNNYEIGLTSTWTIGSTTGMGHMDITLKHQPEVKDGTCTPGETDVEAHFDILIQ